MRHAAVGCQCTLHVSFASLDEVEAPENDAEQERMRTELATLAAGAGFILTFTCASCLVGNVSLKGEICAWTESPAVVYANSILAARTTSIDTRHRPASEVQRNAPLDFCSFWRYFEGEFTRR